MNITFDLLNSPLPILLLAVLGFYVALNLGANDVANSMGTSVGSKALTLPQALIVAGILEFTGATIFGHKVSKTLATEVVNLEAFVKQPHILLVGMVSVMLACGLWLQIATSWGLPVASSHAVVGALAGFSWVAAGSDTVDWQTIGLISLTWLLTPIVSGTIAAGFYRAIAHSILEDNAPMQKLQEWVPWLSAALFGIFGAIALPRVTAPVNDWIAHQFGLILPAHDLPLIFGSVAAITLTAIVWRSADFGTDLKQNVEKAQDRVNSARSLVEKQLAKFQVLSACFVAFAHGSNDVGNAIAPLAVISYILRTDSVPGIDFTVPLWILILGGAGLVTGLAIWGKNVIATIGENILSLQPSAGFCAELATASTVLMASRAGLPVSTSHALVGGVIGIGIVQNFKSVRWPTVQSILLAWLITVPAAAGLGAILFKLLTGLF